MPKPPPRLRERTGRGSCRASLSASSKDLPLRVADRLGPQVLGTGEQMEAFERQARVADPAQHSGTCSDIDAELLRPAAHLHARTLQLEVGVHAHAPRAPAAEFGDDAGEQSHLARSTRR